MNVVTRVLTGGLSNKKPNAYIEGKTFITITDPVKQYSSFFIRLILATIIASCGIAAESTAVIIGAMLIAPLMSPIVGTSFAITTGKPKAALKTLGLTALGVLTVLAFSMFVTFILPAGVSLTGNDEISSRVEPRVVDLVVAIASGCVGALAITRKDISDVIPGVAIAISIVPPLCVTGVALFEGDYTIASGSFLSFIVNFFAIQLAGNILFFFMGYGKRITDEGQINVRRFWYTTAIVGTLLLAIPLIATSNQIAETAALERSTRIAVHSWLENTSYTVASTTINDNKLTIEIAGDGDYPSIEKLKSELAEQGVYFDKTSIMVMNEYH